MDVVRRVGKEGGKAVLVPVEGKLLLRFGCLQTVIESVPHPIAAQKKEGGKKRAGAFRLGIA